MKLELIAPGWKSGLWDVKWLRLPPLSLATIAALTPDDVEVDIVDENVQPVNFNNRADIVGISAMTPLAPRAYEIADEFRHRGVPVVLGGVHPSLLPDEAIQHADAVLIGEAEAVWGDVISDFQNRGLKRFYRCDKPPLENLPVPRRDLFNRGDYFTLNTIQATRGCPYNCDFCAVSRLYGHAYRYRPVEDVARDVSSFKGKFMSFLDDNIFGNPRYAKELFKAIAQYGMKWTSQASLTKDEELLKLAGESGCMSLFVGFESISTAGLEEIHKKHNMMVDYREAVTLAHDYGIGIFGGFILGLDSDTPDVFKQTLDFVNDIGVDCAQFTLLTPYPGTKLYEKLEKEGRIFDRNWSHYDCAHVVFEPKQMTADELQQGFYWAFDQFYSSRSILKRALKMPMRAPYVLYTNYYFRKAVGELPRHRAMGVQDGHKASGYSIRVPMSCTPAKR